MIEKPKGKYTPGLDKLVEFCFEIQYPFKIPHLPVSSS